MGTLCFPTREVRTNYGTLPYLLHPPLIQESQIFGLVMSSACVSIHRLKLATSVHISVLPPQQLVVQTLVWSLPVLPVMLNQRVYGTVVYSVVVSVP
jgi:hypothetical protein